MTPVEICYQCGRNLAYVKAPVRVEKKIFCGPGCVSIADGTTAKNIRQSRRKDRMALLLRYYLLLAIGAGCCISTVIIYGSFFSGTFGEFRRPISFLIVPILGVSIFYYSLMEIIKLSKNRRR